ncbi:MAG: hypothetical protein IIB94_14175 [Candidatus Marinimicrobia bacterium]|nr:hypothetical protein [Candidatus Neomarinimicrobiota bacterium]
MVNLELIVEKHGDLLLQIKEKVNEFELSFNGDVPDPIGVTIWKDAEGKFWPVPSHIPEFKDGGGPYSPTFSSWDTPDEALDEIFKSGYPFENDIIIRWVNLDEYLSV